jgi:hypothetical protein
VPLAGAAKSSSPRLRVGLTLYRLIGACTLDCAPKSAGTAVRECWSLSEPRCGVDPCGGIPDGDPISGPFVRGAAHGGARPDHVFDTRPSSKRLRAAFAGERDRERWDSDGRTDRAHSGPPNALLGISSPQARFKLTDRWTASGTRWNGQVAFAGTAKWHSPMTPGAARRSIPSAGAWPPDDPLRAAARHPIHAGDRDRRRADVCRDRDA